MTALEVLFTPADFARLSTLDLSETTCVVFDVLRATTSMVTALGNGALAILPVEEIGDALQARNRQPGCLLAGEREGLRIGPERTGGVTFDLGNSPREFTHDVVSGKTIIMTTTNGTRALHACRRARSTLASSLLNLSSTAERIRKAPTNLKVVCSGTFEETAYEDVLGAGALCTLIWDRYSINEISDSAHMARELFQLANGNMAEAISRSRNGRRLLSKADLRDDVAFCFQRDTQPIVAALGKDGFVRRELS